jgi:hypothetical protein
MAEEQLAFFDMPPPAQPPMQMTAVIIGDCRYELRRIWDESLPLLVVCMLNPSTADHEKNDPTILTLIHFAKLWGFGGLYVVNLHGLRTPSPAEMMRSGPQLAIGDSNKGFLIDAIGYAKQHGRSILAAWGNHGGCFGMDEWFVRECGHRGVDLVCLGTTDSGQPKHPMARGHHRIPRDQQPLLWKSAA